MTDMLDRRFSEFDKAAIAELLTALADDRCPECQVLLTRGDGAVWCATCDPSDRDNGCLE